MAVQISGRGYRYGQLFKIPEDTPIQLQTNLGYGDEFVLDSAARRSNLYDVRHGDDLYLQADEQGSYYGSGANFNGKEFAKMTFKTDACPAEDYNAWVQDVKNNDPALTMEGFNALKQPGSSDVQLFSSSPKDLFNEIVMQYIPEGSSGIIWGSTA